LALPVGYLAQTVTGAQEIMGTILNHRKTLMRQRLQIEQRLVEAGCRCGDR
jgi:hypothetical protein